MKVKTLEQARRFVVKHRICTVFVESSKTLESLWDAVDLPDKQPGETGWGVKVGAVWGWKNQLPAHYPQEIFYGKMKGGSAVLMTLDCLRDHHYPEHHKEIRNCSPLAQQIYELIRQERYETTELRRDSMEQFGCTKNQFDAALKELQVTLNIVRSNEPGIDRDTWLPFQEIYLEIYQKYHIESQSKFGRKLGKLGHPLSG
jgi:hypothetical protein